MSVFLFLGFFFKQEALATSNNKGRAQGDKSPGSSGLELNLCYHKYVHLRMHFPREWYGEGF